MPRLDLIPRRVHCWAAATLFVLALAVTVALLWPAVYTQLHGFLLGTLSGCIACWANRVGYERGYREAWNDRRPPAPTTPCHTCNGTRYIPGDRGWRWPCPTCNPQPENCRPIPEETA